MRIQINCHRLQNGERLGLGFYSELDNEPETTLAISNTTSLFPSPSRTEDSDTNWSERASSRSSIIPAITDHASLPTMTSKEIKKETITETEPEVKMVLHFQQPIRDVRDLAGRSASC
jgi:hypothetical protein